MTLWRQQNTVLNTSSAVTGNGSGVGRRQRRWTHVRSDIRIKHVNVRNEVNLLQGNLGDDGTLDEMAVSGHGDC